MSAMLQRHLSKFILTSKLADSRRTCIDTSFTMLQILANPSSTKRISSPSIFTFLQHKTIHCSVIPKCYTSWLPESQACHYVSIYDIEWVLNYETSFYNIENSDTYSWTFSQHSHSLRAHSMQNFWKKIISQNSSNRHTTYNWINKLLSTEWNLIRGTSTLKTDILNKLGGEGEFTMAEWLASLNKQEEGESEVKKIFSKLDDDSDCRSECRHTKMKYCSWPVTINCAQNSAGGV